MVTAVFLIGVVNFGVGFVIAVYLRCSPQVDLFIPSWGLATVHLPWRRVRLPAWWTRCDTIGKRAPQAGTSPPSPKDAHELLHTVAPSRTASPAEPRPASIANSVDSSPPLEVNDHVGMRFDPQLLDALALDARTYRSELLGIEDQLQTLLTNGDERLLELLVARYQRVNNDWAQRLFSEANRLHGSQDRLADEWTLVRTVEDLSYDQAAHILELCQKREPLSLDAVRTDCRHLFGDVCTLTELAHTLRDQLLDVSRQLHGPETLTAEWAIDELTRLPNLAGLDRWFVNWRSAVEHTLPAAPPPVAVAMIDVDRFRLLNERQGHRYCDQLLTALGGFLNEHFQQEGLPGVVVHLPGATFLLVWEGKSLAAAITSVEHIRQSLEATTFEYGETDSAITISGAVCSLHRITSAAVLLPRLQTALVTAKQAGRNRLCAQTESGWQVVTPVRLAITCQTLKLNTGDAS